MSGFIEIAISIVIYGIIAGFILWFNNNVLFFLPAWLLGFIEFAVAIKIVLFIIHRKD